tara:strand:- start:227 stop:487 length:261 start_codon:yes stop_codon:yes gene_type:complete
MTTTFYKDKVIKLQQMLDEKDDEIKRLNNELLLCQESKEYPEELSRGNKTATPLPRFEPPDVATILEGRIAAMKRYNKKMNGDDNE